MPGVDWSLANKNQYDYLDSLQQAGQAAFTQSQAARSQYQLKSQQRQDAARPQILADARSGNFAGAEDASFLNGDDGAYKFVSGLREDQRAAVRAHAELIGATAADLSGIPQEQWQSAFAARVPQLKAAGISDEELQQAASNLTPQGLQGYITAAMGTKAALDRYEESQKNLTVADGARVFGATPMGGGERPIIADNPKDIAPQRPVWDSERGGWVYPPSPGAPTGSMTPLGGGGPTSSGGAISVATLKPLFSAQESGGSYTARNAETGAMGRWQVMPDTGRGLAKRLGLEWRPDMMLHDTPADREYQDKIGEAAIAEAVDKSGGDPTKAFGYYYSGTTNQSKWGPKTRQYISDMTARLSGGDPRAPQSAPQGGGFVPVVAPKDKSYRILSPQEAQQRGLDASSRWQIGPSNQVTSLPSKGDKPLTESQGKATGYLERAVAAADALNGIPNAPKPDEVNASLYGMSNANPLRRNMSPLARQALSAQEAFVMAILRQDSGAAISAGEIQSGMRTYFPQPGDDAATQANKRKQREAAIRGLRTAAGPGADSVRGSVAPGTGARGPLRVLKIERVQ
jgi:hypothetical protein